MNPKIDKKVAARICVYVDGILRIANAKMKEEDFWFIEMRAESLLQYIYNNSMTEEELEAEEILSEQTSNYYKDIGL